MGKILNAYRDLDLDPDEAQYRPSYFHILQRIPICVPRSISFRVIVQKHTQTRTHTHTHTDSNEYSIVAFSKNATIINCV